MKFIINIISDNSYFLSGIEAIPYCSKQHVVTFNVNHHLDHFQSLPGEVVIVDIKDVHTRSCFLRRPELHQCGVIILVDIKNNVNDRKRFPWIVSRKLMTPLFLSTLHSLKGQPFRFRKYSADVRNVFSFLSEGNSHQNFLALKKDTYSKYVYNVKYMVYGDCGLSGCHSSAILLCRDIVSMNFPRGK